MTYYQDEHIIVRTMEEKDAQMITDAEIAQGWKASVQKYHTRLNDQKANKAVALIAEYNGAVAGYINVYWHAATGPFADKHYPEIVDFGVLITYRNHGIGTILMDIAEKIAAKRSNTVCLGVGLHSGYGSAQRMYVKRGYIPDGSGVWYKDGICPPYGACRNDDDLVLYFSKKL